MGRLAEQTGDCVAKALTRHRRPEEKADHKSDQDSSKKPKDKPSTAFWRCASVCSDASRPFPPRGGSVRGRFGQRGPGSELLGCVSSRRLNPFGCLLPCIPASGGEGCRGLPVIVCARASSTTQACAALCAEEAERAVAGAAFGTNPRSGSGVQAHAVLLRMRQFVSLRKCVSTAKASAMPRRSITTRLIASTYESPRSLCEPITRARARCSSCSSA